MEKKLKEAIYKYALQNAIKYEGKANPGALVGRIMGEFPDYRDKTKQVVDTIKGIVNDVNSMSVEEQTAKLKELAPELLEKKKVDA